MIDMAAARARKRRERAASPDKCAALSAKHKRAQRSRVIGEVERAMRDADAAWSQAGRRGVAWTKKLRDSLRSALDAVERYREVK